MPSCERRATLCLSMASPSSSMLPADTLTNPVIASMSVVLPAPFGPIKPRISPGSTLIDTSSRATTPPNRPLRLRTCSDLGGARSTGAASRRAAASTAVPGEAGVSADVRAGASVGAGPRSPPGACTRPRTWVAIRSQAREIGARVSAICLAMPSGALHNTKISPSPPMKVSSASLPFRRKSNNWYVTPPGVTAAELTTGPARKPRPPITA